MKTTGNDIKFNVLLKGTAVCSFLGALTTALLFLIPSPSTGNFEESALLYTNRNYVAKLWILFIHPQVNFLAATGIAFLLFRKYPLQIIFGTFFLFIWAVTEMLQQSLLIDTLNQIWRPGYIETDDTNLKNTYSTLIKAANGISDSKYFLVIYAFGIGTLLYGYAFIREHSIGKWIGIACIFIGLLSLSSFLRYFLGVDSLNGVVNWTYKWIYPILQPMVRIAIGIWILLEIKKSNDKLLK